MSKSLHSQTNKRKQKAASHLTSKDKWRLFGIGGFLAAAMAVFWVLDRSGSTQKVEQQTPPFLEASAAARELPATLAPAQFSDPSVKEAYVAALKIPHVLAQQPCYCWCSRIGHQSLLDCYRTKHAVGCSICVKEAILANRKRDAGKTPEEIRSAIVAGEWSQVP